MREVEEREIRSYKCPMCGSRNKHYHDICYDTETNKIGYHYRCCNCGTETLSTNPDIDVESLPKSRIIHTNYQCFIVTGCKNYYCPHNPAHKSRPFPSTTDGSGVSTTSNTTPKSVSPAELRINSARWHEGSVTCDKYR